MNLLSCYKRSDWDSVYGASQLHHSLYSHLFHIFNLALLSSAPYGFTERGINFQSCYFYSNKRLCICFAHQLSHLCDNDELY